MFKIAERAIKADNVKKLQETVETFQTVLENICRNQDEGREDSSMPASSSSGARFEGRMRGMLPIL